MCVVVKGGTELLLSSRFQIPHGHTIGFNEADSCRWTYQIIQIGHRSGAVGYLHRFRYSLASTSIFSRELVQTPHTQETHIQPLHHGRARNTYSLPWCNVPLCEIRNNCVLLCEISCNLKKSSCTSSLEKIDVEPREYLNL